jgi:cell division protein FtsW
VAKKGMRFDVPLCLGVLALVGVGMVLIYSSSAAYADARGLPESFYLAQHVKKVVIGLLAFLVAMTVPFKFWERAALPMLGVGVVLLMYVLVAGGGINGASRWVFGIQPSELAKIALIFYMARRLSEKAAQMHLFARGLLASLIVPAFVMGLIILQPNYSMVLMLCGITAAMVFAAGARPGHLLLLAAAGVPALVLLLVTSAYRMRRVLAFIDPSANPASSYQSLQALISLGNGGLLGTGLGNGTQKLGYLPMPFTDTVFAILGEETGFLGTMIVLGLFGLILWRGLRIARLCPDRFGGLAAAGISVSVALNVAMHVGVCVKLFPTTGQPLPFVSYGGSSLIANLFAMGILLNISSSFSGAASAASEPKSRLVWHSERRATPLRPFTPARAGNTPGGRA